MLPIAWRARDFEALCSSIAGIRGVPQVGLPAAMREMISRSAFDVGLLPDCRRLRDIHFQYTLNPARCQLTTVWGWTMSNARFHPVHHRRKVTQKSRSCEARRGRGCFAAKTASC